MANLNKFLWVVCTLFNVGLANAQSVACPEVFIGGGIDTVKYNFTCSLTDPQCTTIVVQFPDIRQTANGANAYVCNSIPFSGNAGFTTLPNTVIVNQDDEYSSAITLPFSFCYYGNTYTRVAIGANGTITFNSSYFGQGEDYQANYAAVPSPNVGGGTHLNTILACFTDINPSCGGSISWQLVGAAPCRKLVVNWLNIPLYKNTGNYCYSGSATFQCVLYENTNVIETYIQQKATNTAWLSGDAIVGIQNSNGTQGIAAPGRNMTVFTVTTTNSEAWQFVPNGSSLLSGVGLYNSATQALIQSGTAVAAGSGMLQATFNNICVSSSSNPANYYIKAAYNSCSGTNFADSTQILMTIDNAVPPPTVTSPVTYCQNDAASPLSATGTNLLWYTTATGGTGSATAPTPSTTTAGTTTYYVSQTASSCESPRDSIVVTVYPHSAAITGSLLYCQSAGSTTLTATGGGTYEWSSGEQTASINATQAGSPYTVTVTVNSCTTTATASVQQITVPPISFTQTPNPLCIGQAEAVIDAGSQTGISYTWSTGSTTDTIHVSAGGTVSVTASVDASCSATGTYTVATAAAPTLSLVPNVRSCCQDVILNANPDSTLSYLWSTGDTTPSLLIHSLTTVQNQLYSVTATSADGCTVTAFDTVSIYCINARGTATPDTVAPPQVSSLHITTGYNGSFDYVWTVDSTLAASGNSAAATPSQTTFYSVAVTDSATGCVDSVAIQVVVIVPGLFVMPTAFSPNGDGHNDTYYPVYFTSQAVISDFRVYNRWGELIHNSPSQPWDGKFKNEEQPSEVYTYFVHIKLPNPNDLTSTLDLKQEGSFTLLR